MFKVVKITADDFDRGYMQLLNQLTLAPTDEIDKELFANHLSLMNKNSQKDIFVIHGQSESKVIATASMLYEYKFSRNFGLVAHIEDVVVDENYRNLGLGKMLIMECKRIAEELKAYKIILDCNTTNVTFYEKCDFKQNEVQMAYYYPK